MRMPRASRWFNLSLVTGTALMALALSGCPQDNPIGTHLEKVYIVGDIKGALMEEISQIFANKTAYDGTSADAAILIAADSVQSMTETEKEGLRKTYGNYYPVVVADGSEAEINAVLGVLGVDQTYVLPAKETYAELFAVDREEGGHAFMWSTLPPREGVAVSGDKGAPSLPAYADNSADQLVRTDTFHSWLDADKQRMTPKVKAIRLQAGEALAAAAKDDGTDLADISQLFSITYNEPSQQLTSQNDFQVTYNIYSCHSFDAADGTDYDWFYVLQEGMFNASAAYHGITPWSGGIGVDLCQYYVGDYRMTNRMMVDEIDMSLMVSTPENVDNVAQVTSGVDWNFNGSVGFHGGNATGSLSAGVTINNSTTFNVSDCTVRNNSSGGQANWEYDFARCKQVNYIGYGGLTEPPLLSRGNFQPTNQWIWKLDPVVRDSNVRSFESTLTVDLISSVAGQTALWFANPVTHAFKEGGAWQFTVPLSFPPLLVVQHNMDFGAVGSHSATDISVSRAWTASSNQAWCHVDPPSGTAANTHVNVTVDPNTTGANRTATITFQTADGKGTDTMIVFQDQY